jgi:hypothetical protein
MIFIIKNDCRVDYLRQLRLKMKVVFFSESKFFIYGIFNPGGVTFYS